MISFITGQGHVVLPRTSHLAKYETIVLPMCAAVALLAL